MAVQKRKVLKPDTRANIAKAEVWTPEYYSAVQSMTHKERMEYRDNLILAKQTHMKRLTAIAGVYQTSDSILARRAVSVQVGDFSNTSHVAVVGAVPAYNDGQTIYLNADVIDGIDDSSLVSLWGLNVHELAHLLFTPRAGSSLVKSLISEGLIKPWNLLEDQRIETLMVALYPSTAAFLTEANLRYIVGNAGEYAANIMVSIHGRKFIPLEIRQRFADLFIAKYGAKAAQKVAAIIDEYRTLSLPASADSKRALELVRELSQLLGIRDDQTQPPSGSGGSGEGQPDEGEGEGGSQGGSQGIMDGSINTPCTNREPMHKGAVQSGSKQSALNDKTKQSEQGKQDTDLDGNGKGNSDTEPQESNSESNDESGGNGAGGASGVPVEYDPNKDRNGMDDSLRELLEQTLNNLMRSKEVRQEVTRTREAIKMSDEHRNGVGSANYQTLDVPMDDVANARAFGDELVQLQIDNDPAWHRETPSGKLNIQRTMNMDVNDIGSLFDRWDIGNDAFDIEAVILTDNSGSMDMLMGEACRASWTIKRALETIDSNVTSYVFDDTSRLLYSASDKATARTFRAVGATGTTNPIDGLLEAERILSTSRRKTKLLFIVTDGEWNDTKRNNEIISRINDIDGVISNVVFIANPEMVRQAGSKMLEEKLIEWQHGCHNFTMVNQPREIVNVARNLVRSLSLVGAN